MKSNITIDGKTFDFEYDPSLNNWMESWLKLIENQSTSKENWQTINVLPNKKFKNLRISEDMNHIELDSEIMITITYDDVQDL